MGNALSSHLCSRMVLGSLKNPRKKYQHVSCWYFHTDSFQIYLNLNQLIRLRTHMERLHGVKLMEAMAGFHTFDEIMILLL